MKKAQATLNSKFGFTFSQNQLLPKNEHRSPPKAKSKLPFFGSMLRRIEQAPTREARLLAINDFPAENFMFSKHELLTLAFALTIPFPKQEVLDLRRAEVSSSPPKPKKKVKVKSSPIEELVKMPFETFERIAIEPSANLPLKKDQRFRLEQKEIIFNKSLEVVYKDGIDINKLIFNVYEGLMSDNYFPLKEDLRLEGFFEYSDRVKCHSMPINSSLRRNLHLSLEQIPQECFN